MPPKRRSASRTAAVIKGAMTRRGASTRTIADALGVSLTMVRFWTSGRYIPSIAFGERLAEILNDEGIANAVRAGHQGRCAYLPCGRPFARNWRGGKRQFCSDRCRGDAHLFPDRRRDPRQDAIDAFCASCEPDGLCRTAECPLRAWSPFLYVPMSAAS